MRPPACEESVDDTEHVLPVPVSHRRVRRTYERTARLYAQTVARLEAPSQRQALSQLELSSGESVVDIGCGPGRLLPRMATQVGPRGEVYGVDPAPSMLAQARQQARSAGVTDCLSLLRGDGRQLPVADESVEAACAFDVLDLFTWTDLKAVLDECHRILGADGRLCVVTMDRTTLPDSRFLRLYEWVYRRLPGAGVVGCRPIPAATALRESRFTIESTTRLRRGGIWPVTSFVCTPA